MQRIDKDENKCVFDLVAGGTTEEEMMRADVIAGEVRPFQSHITLSFSLFGLTGQSNLLLWLRKPETVLLLLFLVTPSLVTSSFRPTHFQHD